MWGSLKAKKMTKENGGGRERKRKKTRNSGEREIRNFKCWQERERERGRERKREKKRERERERERERVFLAEESPGFPALASDRRP